MTPNPPVFGIWSDASYRIVVYWEYDENAVGYLVEWRDVKDTDWESQQYDDLTDTDTIIRGSGAGD